MNQPLTAYQETLRLVRQQHDARYEVVRAATRRRRAVLAHQAALEVWDAGLQASWLSHADALITAAVSRGTAPVTGGGDGTGAALPPVPPERVRVAQPSVPSPVPLADPAPVQAPQRSGIPGQEVAERDTLPGRGTPTRPDGTPPEPAQREHYILEQIARDGGGVNWSQIMRDMNVSRTTVYRDRDNLVEQGRIAQHGDGTWAVVTPNGHLQHA